MKNVRYCFLALLIGLFPMMMQAQPAKYKCLIQMKNYMGNAAYMVVSLVNSKGEYEKTLCVLGPNKRWYNSLKEWHRFYSQKPVNINAVTGASISGGFRTIKVLELDKSKLNKGYKIRFETSVEDQKYYAKDLELPFSSASLNRKSDGTGYIRYVMLRSF